MTAQTTPAPPPEVTTLFGRGGRVGGHTRHKYSTTYLNVKMSREPVSRLQAVQQVLRRGTSQSIGLHLFGEKGFFPQQLLHIAVVGNAPRPVVRKTDVQVTGKKPETKYFKLSHMVGATLSFVIKGGYFVVA
jgi:hypothetical protein